MNKTLSLFFVALLLGGAFLLGRTTAPAPDFSQYTASPAAVGMSNAPALWGKFTEDVRIAGQQILAQYPRDDDIDQAEALRYMLQQLQTAIEVVLIRQPGEPALLRLGATTINKWGLDSADAKYMGAAVDSQGTYLLRGTLGSARLFAVQLSTTIRTYKGYGEITGDKLVTDKAGNFELLISQTKPADWNGNWLAMDPGATDLLVREYFRDWKTEHPGSYYLERLDDTVTGEPLSKQAVATLMDDAIGQFYLRVPQWQERSNQIVRFLANKVRMAQTEDGLAANFYGPGWFEVEQDQALLIELQPTAAAMWSVQLGNYWWESLDYLGHTASYNDSQAVADPDGVYRFVLSHQDPGIANWLDPTGHEQGMILFRQLQAEGIMEPKMTLVPYAKLANYLPKDGARASPEDRQQARRARFQHAARRWAP